MKLQEQSVRYTTARKRAVVVDLGASLEGKPHFPGALPTPDLIAAIEKGLPFQQLVALQECFGVSLERLAGILGMAKATLNRRRALGRLMPEESDRVVRFARLFQKATEVLEAEEQARQWLTAPQRGLGGAIPLEYAKTEVGAREVDALLNRIEHGVYS